MLFSILFQTPEMTLSGDGGGNNIVLHLLCHETIDLEQRFNQVVIKLDIAISFHYYFGRCLGEGRTAGCFVGQVIPGVGDGAEPAYQGNFLTFSPCGIAKAV